MSKELSYRISIQCPDCGTIFVLNEEDEFFCTRCKRVYKEDEVRKRCAL